MIGAYIHIPFCIKKCAYCDFVSFPQSYKIDDIKERYLVALMKEIEDNCPNHGRVDTVYFGGGTPGILTAEQLKSIIDCFLDYNEATIEVNPKTVDKKKLEQIKEMGFNRISIGIQTLNDTQLQLIGRSHTADEGLETLRYACEIFDNVSVDIMTGLPSQRLCDFKETLSAIMVFNPSHISCYSLTLEPGTPLYNAHFPEHQDYPTQEQEREMYWYLDKNLTGFVHYELSNWAKPGFECKHNSIYWTNQEYVGFGLAAHSYYGGYRYSNTTSMEEYLGGITTVEREFNEDVSDEYYLLGLRMLQGVVDNGDKRIDKLVKQRLLTRDGGIVKLTERGIDMANYVFREFV